MNAHKTILTAVAAAVIGIGASAAQAQTELPGYFDDKPNNNIKPAPDHPQRGGTIKPPDPRPEPGRSSDTSGGVRSQQGTIETSREVRVVTPPVNTAPVTTPPMTTNNTNNYMQNGIDTRFLKPADPAKVNPDTQANAGVNRVLAEDRAINGQGYVGRTTNGEVVKDVSNNPIDSLNDPRFKNPVIPADQMLQAQPASERMAPVVVPPANTNSGVIAPRTNTDVNTSGSTSGSTGKDGEYKSTWSSPSDRRALDPAVRDHQNSPEVDKSMPAPMKGERAPNALDNTLDRKSVV